MPAQCLWAGRLSLETPFMFQWTKRKSVSWLLCVKSLQCFNNTRDKAQRTQANATEIKRNQEQLWDAKGGLRERLSGKEI